MLCYLIYITYEEFRRQTKQRSETEFYQEIPIENKELLFNPNCYIGIIVDYLVDKVGIPRDIKNRIDLVDKNSQLLNIHQYPPDLSGLNILKNGAVYYLVLNEEDHMKMLISVTSSQNLEFFGGKRHSKSNKSRKISHDIEEAPKPEERAPKHKKDKGDKGEKSDKGDKSFRPATI